MQMPRQHDKGRQFDIALSETRSALIQDFHHHWLTLCRGDLLPGRRDLDPSDFKHILPHVILSDIERSPLRVRYRLCGTRVVEFCGNLTGRYLDAIEGAELWQPEIYQAQYATVVEQRRPTFYRDWMVNSFDTHYPFLVGIWPLNPSPFDLLAASCRGDRQGSGLVENPSEMACRTDMENDETEAGRSARRSRIRMRARPGHRRMRRGRGSRG